MIDIALIILASLVAIPICILAALCFAALLPVRRTFAQKDRLSAAILIPAHNEAAGLGATLRSLVAQMQAGDRLVVIADNCTDSTAEVARALGAEVLERHHETQRGKGYALAFGLDFLRPNPPAVVVMMDADCLAEAGAVDQLIRAAGGSNRPVQAIYLMESPKSPTVKDHLSAFAFLTKNLVRPRGLSRMGCPVMLTGTGMAFAWGAIGDVEVGSGNIVEDMQLGIDLALRGRMPQLCPGARVIGQLPTGEKSAFTQRKRWEHGHLRTLLTQVPRLVWGGVMKGHPSLLVLAADLLIPPLALLAMLWVGVAGLLAGTCLLLPPHQVRPALSVHIISGGLFFLAAAIAWGGFARRTIPLKALLSVPIYMIWKIPMYFGFVTRPEKKWIRTDR